MKKFKFRFRTVLRHRERKEDKLKEELAHLSRSLSRDKDILARLETGRELSRGELKIKQRGKVNGEEVLRYQTYLIKLGGDIVSQRGKVNELVAVVDQKHEDLVKASREKRIIEKLGERDYKRFKEGLLKAEQQFIDEIAGNRFNRSRV